MNITKKEIEELYKSNMRTWYGPHVERVRDEEFIHCRNLEGYVYNLDKDDKLGLLKTIFGFCKKGTIYGIDFYNFSFSNNDLDGILIEMSKMLTINGLMGKFDKMINTIEYGYSPEDYVYKYVEYSLLCSLYHQLNLASIKNYDLYSIFFSKIKSLDCDKILDIITFIFFSILMSSSSDKPEILFGKAANVAISFNEKMTTEYKCYYIRKYWDQDYEGYEEYLKFSS